MSRLVIVDGPADALDDLKKRLAKEKVEYEPFVRKVVGAAEGVAIACAAVNLVKIIWDWYNSWRGRQADVEVQITLHPDNITIRLAPSRRTELEVLIQAEKKPKNMHLSD